MWLIDAQVTKLDNDNSSLAARPSAGALAKGVAKPPLAFHPHVATAPAAAAQQQPGDPAAVTADTAAAPAAERQHLHGDRLQQQGVEIGAARQAQGLVMEAGPGQLQQRVAQSPGTMRALGDRALGEARTVVPLESGSRVGRPYGALAKRPSGTCAAPAGANSPWASPCCAPPGRPAPPPASLKPPSPHRALTAHLRAPLRAPLREAPGVLVQAET